MLKKYKHHHNSSFECSEAASTGVTSGSGSAAFTGDDLTSTEDAEAAVASEAEEAEVSLDTEGVGAEASFVFFVPAFFDDAFFVSAPGCPGIAA